MTGLHDSLSFFNRSGNLSPLLIIARIVEKPTPDTETTFKLALSSQNSLWYFEKNSWIIMISYIRILGDIPQKVIDPDSLA
jgi:hypothetical protein